MFSSTLKQSVATLGVVAGLLAAAGPASAQILDGPVLAKAGPQPEAGGYLATDPSSEVDNQIRLSNRGEVTGLEPTVKAPANAMSAGISGQEMTNAVKAPASPASEVFTSVSNVAPLHGDATTIWVWHEAARNGIVLNTFGGNDTLRGHGITCLDQDLVTVKGPTNSPSCGVSQSDSLENTMVSGYNVKADAEGTQVGSEGVKSPTQATPSEVHVPIW
jgi:hypothetical protein